MNNVLLKYVYYGITVVSLVVLGLSVKYLLGGYDEIVIEETDEINYVIAGKYVDQEWSDDQRNVWNLELAEKLESGAMKGQLVEVCFFPDTLETVSPTRFSGVAMMGNIVTIPSGYQILDIYESGAMKTLLKMNPLVRPSLDELRIMMKKSSNDSNSELDDRLLLFPGGQDSLTVMVGVK